MKDKIVNYIGDQAWSELGNIADAVSDLLEKVPHSLREDADFLAGIGKISNAVFKLQTIIDTLRK